MNARRTTMSLAAFAGALLFGAGTLVAQSPGGAPGSPAPMPQSGSAPSQPGQPMASQPGSMAPDTSPQGMADHAFISDAMEGNMGEVQLAQLAEQKSQSNDVKQLAQRLASDHSQMNQKWFEPEAKQLDISAPKKPSKKDQKLMKKLQGLNGDQFDKEYISAMLKDHEEDLKKFKEEAEASQNPAMKQMAQQGATVISKHLQMTEQVAKNHNVDVDKKGNEK